MLPAEQLATYYLKLQQQWSQQTRNRLRSLALQYQKSLAGRPPSVESAQSFVRGVANLLPGVPAEHAIIAILIGLLHPGGVNVEIPGRSAVASTGDLQRALQQNSQLMSLLANLLRAQHDSMQAALRNVR